MTVILLFFSEKTETANINIWQGGSERSDWFFLGRDIAIRTVSMHGNGSKLCSFRFRPPYNKLLNNLACSSRTGKSV